MRRLKTKSEEEFVDHVMSTYALEDRRETYDIITIDPVGSKDFDDAFSKVDVLLAPTAPTTAFGSGDNIDNPMAMYLSDLLTIPANLAGLPAISLPCGFDKSGLPIGLQLIGNVFEEGKLLQVANQFEKAAEVYKNRPKTDFTL